MKKKYRSEKNLNISFLICSILTIDPFNSFFKKLDVKNGLGPDPNTKNQSSILWYLYSEDCKTEFYGLLNKRSIRQTAYEIIKPIIKNRKYNFILDKKKSHPKNLKMVKEYLKKYKVIYKKYFLTQPKSNNTKNDRIINSVALHALFLIVGI